MKAPMDERGLDRTHRNCICIFTPTGRTYTFRDITVETDNESVLAFRYLAMSDGNEKRATFLKNMVCGFSAWLEPIR